MLWIVILILINLYQFLYTTRKKPVYHVYKANDSARIELIDKIYQTELDFNAIENILNIIKNNNS